jgi:hypothetical protein
MWRNYDAAWSDYEEAWGIFNETLYALCRRYPGHESRGSLNAKVQIIARSYGTGIERQIASTGGMGGSLGRLTGHLWARRAEIDAAIERLGTVAVPLAMGDLRTIAEQHGRFTRLVRVVTPGQTPRAFAAKYLHFHCPAVPIYDSNAARALRRLYRWRSSFALFDMPEEADPEYTWFLFRFWRLYEAALAARPDVTVRRLDYYLLAVADGRPA